MESSEFVIEKSILKAYRGSRGNIRVSDGVAAIDEMINALIDSNHR